ncbi:MAG: hypothetical protein KKC03_06085 [Bacteroidetes bacterium]|nr:hypothetical protein [Bacteroidota bacterium]
MAKVSLAAIKNWFKTGLKPTQAQFWDTWDSFRHKDDAVPAAEVEGLNLLLAGKAEATHIEDPNAHAALFAANGLQLVELDWTAQNPIDPAGFGVVELLNQLDPPLVLEKRALVLIRYRSTAPSDGDIAVVKTWIMLLLEAGSYGTGHPDVWPPVVNDAANRTLQLPSRDVVLSTGSITGTTQDDFNTRIEKDLFDFDKNPTFYPFGVRFDLNNSMSWATDYQFRFDPGDSFKGSGNFKVLQGSVGGGGFSNLVEWNSQLDGNIKNLVSISYSHIGIGYRVNVMLQETISNTSFRQWYFSPAIINTDHLEFDFYVRILNKDLGQFEAIINMNGVSYSINTGTGEKFASEHFLLDYQLFQGAFPQGNFPALHRVNFQSNFPGSVELYKLDFGVAFQGNGYLNPLDVWDEEGLIIDYTPLKFGGANFIMTRKNILATMGGVLNRINKPLGEFYHKSGSSLQPVSMSHLLLAHRFDLPSFEVPFNPANPVIPNSVFLQITDNTCVLQVEDSFEYDGVNGTNEIKLMDLSWPHNAGINVNADLIYPGHAWDNGMKCTIRVRENGVYCRLDAGDFQSFFGGEMLAFRVEWKLK